KFQETKKRVNNASPPPRKLAPSPAKKPVAQQPPAPIVPKPKRNPDEELSDGEILSTDEEDNNK
uniref:Uncharacterized protein n=1 Tax=Caenorhabditis japonica TaxID=281687 RepID=A0A8R1EEH3_CAEJA